MSVPRRVAGRGKAEAILAAAERAFLASGFGAVTMDAIAREAGVSKATVYAHFTGKEALFGAVIAHVSERRYDGFSIEALDPHEIEASLTTIAHRFLDLVLAPEVIALNRIIIGEVTRFPVLAQVFWEAGPERTRQQLETFFRRAGAAGVIAVPDPRLAAGRVGEASVPVSLVRASGEHLPFADAIFDTAVTTWTLSRSPTRSRR